MQTRSRTRAARSSAGEARAAAGAALRVLLAHPALTAQQAAVAGLMCASKDLAAEASHWLAGQLRAVRRGGSFDLPDWALESTWETHYELGVEAAVAECLQEESDEEWEEGMAPLRAAFAAELAQLREQTASFVAWLDRHAGLLGALELQLQLGPTRTPPPGAGCCGCCGFCGRCTWFNHGEGAMLPHAWEPDELAVAGALRTAAAAGSLRLRELRLSPPSAPVLEAAAAATSLTRLELAVCDDYAVWLAAPAAALAALTGLRSLRLTGEGKGNPETRYHRELNELLAATSGLTRLTALTAERVRRPKGLAALSQLPASLATLHVQLLPGINPDSDGEDDDDALAAGCGPALRLGHLGSCTSLTLLAQPERSAHSCQPPVRGVLRGGEVLPPRLRMLTVSGCLSPQPLAGEVGASLRGLTLLDCGLAGPDVAALQLPQLTSLRLSAPRSAAAGDGHTAGVLELLAAVLPRLRHLQLAGIELGDELRTLLAGCKRLRTLRLE